MATVEQSDIRGLDIDKTIKGFALNSYVFKNYVNISSTKADSIRWYQETAADMTAVAPSVVANISPLSNFPTLEHSWTRNTSYVRKYAAEGFISIEDIDSADIDVFARTSLRLTRAVAKQVDSRIWDVITENRSASTINSGASTAAWDAGSGQDIIKDILTMKKAISDYDYDASNAVLFLSTTDYKNLMTWLISTKGSSIPGYASDKLVSGVAGELLGIRLVVSTNVTADYAFMMVPTVAATWKEHTPLTSKVIDEAGIGKRIRVWEIGECILTDPRACYLLTNTQT